MEKYLKPVTRQCTQKIMEQMDNTIYKIIIEKDNFGIGFFCHIKIRNKKIPVLITNPEIINEKYIENNNEIKIKIYDKVKTIEIGNKIYINSKYDLSVIEIKPKEDIKINFLEIDEKLYEKEPELYLDKESIYIFNHNIDKIISVSYGVIDVINRIHIKFFCNLNSNINGLPIFNLITNKLVGIYKNRQVHYNQGIFIKFLIKEFIEKYSIKQNEINILVNVNKEDINKEIYFLNTIFNISIVYSIVKKIFLFFS
jgi:hypothetical protein